VLLRRCPPLADDPRASKSRPQARPAPRFAAIDNGSNAIRLKIIEAPAPGAARVLFEKRFPVRLGHEVFQTGRLDPKKVAAALRVYRESRRLMRRHGVAPERVRAVATSAVRDAVNGEEFCALLERKTGFRIETISGAEEARLVRLAVRRALDLSGRRALLFDLGGGSLEISVMLDDEIRFATSLEIGTVRLLEAFLSPAKSVTREQELVVQEFIDRALFPVLPEVRQLAPNVAVGVGGNFETLAQLCPAPDPSGPGVHCGRLDDLVDDLVRLPTAQRRKRFRLRPDRADVIVPAAYIVRRLSQVFDIRRVAVPGVGLREGLLVQLVEKTYGVWDYTEEAAEIANAARALGRRFHFDEAHAEQTERIALRLFDELRPLHELGREEREILRLAALLHDVGTYISANGHHRHSYYIIRYSDLAGLPAERRELVARVARFHRKALPTPRHELMADLSKKEQKVVERLAALLRIADALDREHRRAVTDVHARVERGRVAVHLRSRGDPSLEVWTLRRKSDLFEKVFGRRIEVHAG
jgi:exopolyphosphatase/guanosine-5'-triphosphate,3'-diphosphate pyrophosphatase